MIRNVSEYCFKSKYLKIITAAVFTLGLFLFMGQVVQADTYVTVTGSTVNVRSAPYINDSNRITTVPRGTTVRVVEERGDFFRAAFPDIGYAYIAREWVAFYRTMGVVTGHAAWIYDLADTDDGLPIGLAFEGDSFAVVSYYGDWYGIIYEGELAFVERHHMYVPGRLLTVPPARFAQPIDDSVTGDVVARAMRYLGRPYRWGGNGPYSFDCSGFVIYVLRPLGVTLPRRSRDMASSGVHVARSDVIPGDLLFFATAGGGRVSHVGMYIGGGQFIHSSSSRTGGVVISNLHSAYFTRTFVTARRVL
ncbi:MAG: C40 family peptidase [Defluviitaleaceae bacterium]|nr:C40 family peptidase [Defluviitaleaceae bacterium]